LENAALTWLFILFFAAAAFYDFFDRDEENVGYVPLWVLVVIDAISLLDRYSYLINAVIFVSYFVFLAFLGAKIYKKNFFDIFGEGDYFIFFAIGLYIDNITEFVLFFISLGIAFIVMINTKKEDKEHDYIPMLPLLFAGTISIILDNLCLIERLDVL